MKKFLSILITATALISLLMPVMALAASPTTAVCEGIGATAGGGGCTSPKGSLTVEGITRTALNLLSIVVGVAAVIMIMLGGFKYVTSSGDSAKVGSAKDAILYAIIGLVIVALAQVIVKYVLHKVLVSTK